MVKANVDTMPYGCGLGLIYNFDGTNDRYGYTKKISDLVPEGGAGLELATFVVGDEVNTKAYEALKARWPILYQSEPRYNRNSGNLFYIAIFDTGAPDPDEGLVEDDYYDE